MHNEAFTLMEMTIASAVTLFLMAGVYGFYVATSQDYASGVSQQTLQNGANTVLSKIIEGETEANNVVFRLSTAVSYMIPNGAANALYTCGGAPQAAPCNANNLFGELYYCQVNPCNQVNNVNVPSARWYYINNAGTSIIYHHPNTQGIPVDETIYTAPTGTTLALRFAPATNLPANEVAISVALTKNLAGNITNQRLATSGTATTFVLVRNHT